MKILSASLRTKKQIFISSRWLILSIYLNINMPDSVKPTNTESSSQDEDTNMKRPRDDASQTSSETEDSNVNNKDSESDKDNPSTSPSPKRPKHQAPQLIVFEWTSTDWSDPVDMNDNIDDKNDTPSNQDNSSDYKDVLDLLFDDSLVDI